MSRIFMTIIGATLLLIGVIGAITGSHDHTVLGFGLNGNQNALHVLTGLGALILAWLGRESSRVGCWLYGLAYSAFFLGGAAGSPALAEAFNFNVADHVLHLAVVAGCIWAVTYLPYREDSEDRLDLELELEEGWPQEGALEEEESEEPASIGRFR